MANFQLALEVTRLFDPNWVKNGYEAAIDLIAWARSARKGGSDIVVETDLASTFGRGELEISLKDDFRKAVMRPLTVTTLGRDKKIELHSGAGPTLAWKENPIYQNIFSSIVQLSFLGWVHDRTSLADTLDECFKVRFEGKLSPTDSPGFQGIYQTLESVSSETSAFNWNELVERARSKLCQLVALGDLTYRGDTLCLPPDILLHCLDTLYIVQKDSEQRYMTVTEYRGCLTLIVWAHYILGLSVLVRNVDTSQEVLFGDADQSNPVIFFHLHGSPSPPVDSSIILFNKIDRLSITLDHDLENTKKLIPRERFKLHGYGTVALCRMLDISLETFTREPRNPHMVEAAEIIIAMAMLVSHKLRRSSASIRDTSTRKCSIQSSRIYDAARMFFAHPFSQSADRLQYHEESAEQIFNFIITCKNWTQAFEKKQMSPALSQRLEDMGIAGGAVDDLCELTTTVVCLAMCPTLHDCADLVLVYAPPFEEFGFLSVAVRKWDGDVIKLESHHIFSHFCRLLVGNDLFLGFGNSEAGDVFIVSEFGWTISLGIYRDEDPAHINPEHVYIYEGIPTDSRTGERKSRVRDGEDPVFEILKEGVPSKGPAADRGLSTYQPRCISPVEQRTEYLASRQNGFLISIKLTGEHTEHSDRQNGPLYFQNKLRYRGLHESLWKIHQASECPHKYDLIGQQGQREVRLPINVATSVGLWSWGPQNEPFPERLVVVLVRGDKNARWLSIMAASSRGGGREIMLRGNNCCEECAVNAAANLPGKWAIVI